MRLSTKKGLGKAAAASLALIMLTGCWSRVEINDRAFAVAMFVDEAKDNKIELTLGLAQPNKMSSQSGSGGSSSQMTPYNIVSAIGMTVADAYQNIQTNLPRDVYWGQVKVVLVGEEFARKGVQPVIEFVTRLTDMPLKTYIMVTPGRAKNSSMFTTPVEQFPTEVFRELAGRHKILSSSMLQFLESEEYGQSTIAALVEKGSSAKGKTSTTAVGAALFKDGKMIGSLNRQEMRGALWMTNEIRKAVITLKAPQDGRRMSVLVVRSSTSIKPVQVGDRIVYRVEVNPNGMLLSSDSSIDITVPAELAKIEAEMNRQIASRILTVFNKSKALKADVFQLASYLDWSYPAFWKSVKANWNEVYKSRVELDVQVHTSIKALGASTRGSENIR